MFELDSDDTDNFVTEVVNDMTDKQKYLVRNSLYHWVEAKTEQEALDEAHTVTKIVEEEITGSHPNNRESIILNPNDPFFKL